jgi:hypothetical protein
MNKRNVLYLALIPSMNAHADPGSCGLCVPDCQGQMVTHWGSTYLVGDEGPNIFMIPAYGGTVIAKGGDDKVCQVQIEGRITGPVKIYAGAGNDRVVLGAGNALVYLQGGNDRARVGAGNDRVFCGAGTDSVDGGIGRDGSKECETPMNVEYELP